MNTARVSLRCSNRSSEATCCIRSRQQVAHLLRWDWEEKRVRVGYYIPPAGHTVGVPVDDPTADLNERNGGSVRSPLSIVD